MRDRFIWATTLAIAACFVATGFLYEFPHVIRRALGTSVVELDAATFTSERAGDATHVVVNVPELRHVRFNRRYHRTPAGSPVELRENGVLLEHAGEALIGNPGEYSHYRERVVFRPSAGVTDARYEVRFCTSPRAAAFLTESSPFLWLAAVLALALAIRLPVGLPAPRAAVAILAIGLAAAIVPALAKHWDEVQSSADSATYLVDYLRSPGYPWFIQAVRGPGEFSQEEHSPKTPRIAEPSPAALAVVRSQKIVFWAAWWFASVSLTWAAGRGFALAACFSFALYRFDWLFSDIHNCLMSETLAGAFLLLLVGFAILAAATRSPWFLPPAALAFAAAVLTRVAAGCAIFILLAAIGVVVATHWRHPRRLAIPLILVALIGAWSWMTAHDHCLQRNGFSALSPLQNFERVAFALEVADDEDAESIANPIDRRVFVLARAKRQAIREKNGTADDPIEKMELNVNCWGSAAPALAEVHKDLLLQGAAVPTNSSAFADETFARIADVILPRHRDRRFAIVMHFLRQAATTTTSFRTSATSESTKLLAIPLLWLIVGCAACCLIGRNLAALGALACFGAYALYLVGVCMHEPPLERYVTFAEWLALLGTALSVISLVQRAAERRRRSEASVTSQSPD